MAKLRPWTGLTVVYCFIITVTCDSNQQIQKWTLYQERQNNHRTIPMVHIHIGQAIAVRVFWTLVNGLYGKNARR